MARHLCKMEAVFMNMLRHRPPCHSVGICTDGAKAVVDPVNSPCRSGA